MWIPFRIDGRDMEWHLSERPTRYLHVRSRCGGYHVQSAIRDDVFARTNGRISASVVGAPLVIGPEFPLGSRIPHAPFQMEGGFELAPYGIIHTELVQSLSGRWNSRRRYRRPRDEMPR
jgi:hypothetical protein